MSTLYFQRYLTVIYCLPKVLKVYHIKILRHVGNIHVVCSSFGYLKRRIVFVSDLVVQKNVNLPSHLLHVEIEESQKGNVGFKMRLFFGVRRLLLL